MKQGLKKGRKKVMQDRLRVGRYASGMFLN